ncbi:LacI family DNA-binding transcriptional regulator [Muricauda sp. CAU 1633]|uniref:LacI family DNA-binding transcriptional regulator n=1 Tax=Allomuricauda sp. CAU 1633 TaxID=2816036 RepID=UPI001A8DF902|nr:LacI family DNA-binding transcriptional regulator [Muricauda sp. CAU 1633]MBO0324096.1 LacI family DNA-binding transcriptional regulator [Muricauda sp. CAU 1633]
MSKKVTIYDIAKKLNITAASVSRALNNNPRISESTRKLVLETAAKMNYKPNKVALALRNGKSNSVGVIVPRVNRNFFSNLIRGLEEELYPFGYQVIICQTYDEGKREIDNINALLDAHVGGIFLSISSNTANLDHLKRVINSNVPLIFLDRKADMQGVGSVTINDHEAGYISTQHLIDQGCRRIAHLGGDQRIEIYKDRFEGYKQALHDNNIEFDKKYFYQFNRNNSIDGGKEAVTKLLKLSSPPDAIFSASDFVALGAIQELQKRNVRIPEDFCVSGFSNEPFTKFMELSITSIDQFPIEMGKIAAKVFLEQIKGGHKKQNKVVLDPKLHIRKSTSKL